MRPIETSFASYMRDVVERSGAVGEIQRVETQRAFFAGAAAALSIMGSANGTNATAEQQRALVDLATELRTITEIVRNDPNAWPPRVIGTGV